MRRLVLALACALTLASGPARADALVERARAYLGRTAPELGLPGRLWCADFMTLVTGRDLGRLALSWLNRPRDRARVGAVAVLTRRCNGCGHVGIVSGFDRAGNVRIISGNHLGAVRESLYPAGRVVAYVRP